MTARIVVLGAAILFIYYIVNAGMGPDGAQVAGIQQIKQVFEQVADGFEKLQRM